MDKKLIHSVFEEAAGKYPSSVAIDTVRGVIRYRELNVFANRLAHLLLAVGNMDRGIVNVIMASSGELVGTMIAVFKAGGIYLPVDISFSEQRLIQVFTQTSDGVVVTTRDLLPAVTGLLEKPGIAIRLLIVVGENNELELYRAEGIRLDRLWFQETEEWKENPPLLVNGDSGSYIFYTSGSTGEGKAILGKHSALSHFIHWETREFGIDGSFKVSQLTAPTFDASFRDIFTPLINGGTICIPTPGIKSNPAKLLQWLENARVTLVHCVPSLFRILTRQLEMDGGKQYDLSQLRLVILSGEMVYAKDVMNWRKAAGSQTGLVNFYGATETTLIKMFHRIGNPGDDPSRIIPVGVPISNTSVAIIKDGGLCTTGVIGELYVKTPFATRGYYGREDLTRASFVTNPLTNDPADIVYKTGDMGRYLQDGTIEVLGRMDGLIKVNGVRVEIGEIEKALLEGDWVAEAVVKAHRTDDNLTTLVAYYTGKEVPAQQFHDILLRRLNRPSMPSYFVYLPKLPVNLNGKVDKKALPVPEEVLLGDLTFEAPRDPLENKLEALWREVLGIKRIGRNTSFFTVGGHSLRAVQLILRIQRTLQVSLRVEDIFNNPTIAGLALLLKDKMVIGYAPIPSLPEQPSYAVSSSQRLLWAKSQFEQDNITYTIPCAYIFEGSLDVPSLEYAFNALIERHEILRTTIREDAGELRQFVAPARRDAFRLVEDDLRGRQLTKEDTRQLVFTQLRKPFNLASGPLIRARLWRLNDNQWLFVCSMHHIICDDWSMEIMLRELLAQYQGRISGTSVSLPRLTVQYKEYAAWQQERLGQDDARGHRQYWLEQLGGEIPLLALPWQRPPERTNNGAELVTMIDTASTKALKELCHGLDGTLFMGLMTLVYTLLYTYTGQRDIIIGSPVAGRDHIDLEDQIGFFVNTIALRTRWPAEETFEGLFTKVRLNALSAYEHRSYPFDEVVDALDLKREPSRNLLFDVWVVLHEQMFEGSDGSAGNGNLVVRPYTGVLPVFTKFDLLFSFTDMGEEVRIRIEYNSDILDSTTIGELSERFVSIIGQAAAGPSSLLSDLCVRIEAEEQRNEAARAQQIRNRNLVSLTRKS